jgi:Tat protein secretion system quality control protein TatD with DNase activity
MYHQVGNSKAFATILENALVDDRRSYPHLFSKDEDRIKCFNALSFYFHQLS